MSNMIISASRRTDIPSCYSEWFFDKIKEKVVHVKNPMNHSQIRTVSLTPEDVDCIVFWTKNPSPMINNLDKLNAYKYYFQFTLNPYDQDIETNLPSKKEIIDTFKLLSDKIGKEKVIWRYDPVLLTDKYNIQYHIDNFGKLAHSLKDHTEKVTFSFIDFYKKIMKNIKLNNIRELTLEEKYIIAENFSLIAKANNLIIDTCAEAIDLSNFGIQHARCIDDGLISKITGKNFPAKKDASQRLECGCVKSVDIGEYYTCFNGCVYCYAGFGVR